jgi:hypothetical protein
MKTKSEPGTSSPRESPSGTRGLGPLERFSEFCAAHDAAKVAASLRSSEKAHAIAHIAAIDAWLDRFILYFPQPSWPRPDAADPVEQPSQL